MTRFARAKGSKASNERIPEEATSWSEMKKSFHVPDTPENQSTECIAKTNTEQKQSVWAPLGSDSIRSESLLKQHLSKKHKEGHKVEMVEEKSKVKNKQRALNRTEEKGSASKNGKSKNGIKKRQASFSNESEGRVKKSKKKREKIADDFEEVLPRKKKKVERVVSEPVVKKKSDEVEVRSTKKIKEKKAQTKSGSKIGLKKPLKGEVKGYYENGARCYQEKCSEQSKGKSKFSSKCFTKAPSAVEEIIINGEKIEIVKFQGFYVTLEDAERLKKLRSDMINEGIPRDKLEAAIKLERRRAEKALSRLKKSVCFHCRGHGHLLSNCPELMEKESTGTGICYKCGSTEHSAAECKVIRGSNYQFAECFICKEQGHIARQCPDNPRGLYPQGGACRECGDVTHLRKDCPKVLSKKEEEAVTIGLRSDRNLECLDEEIVSREKGQRSVKAVKKNSPVKF